MPPTSVSTHGRPSAVASINATGSPSHFEAITNTSAAANTSTASAR